MAQNHDFEKAVRIACIEKGISQKDLIDQIKERTGLYVDYSLLRRIFTGQTPGKKVKTAICDILSIGPDDTLGVK